MTMSDLIPWSRNGEASPIFALRLEMNRVFDDFFRGFDLAAPARFGMATALPEVDVSETDTEAKVVAELSGLEKDIEARLQDGVLALKDEKAESNGVLCRERWHGQFQRAIQPGTEVDPDKATAFFRNGVLTITLPKRPEAQRQTKRIPISGTTQEFPGRPGAWPGRPSGPISSPACRSPAC